LSSTPTTQAGGKKVKKIEKGTRQAGECANSIAGRQRGTWQHREKVLGEKKGDRNHAREEERAFAVWAKGVKEGG